MDNTKPVRPFLDTIRDIEHGHLIDELSYKQQAVVSSVIETMQQGEITITLKYKLETKGQVSISAKVKSKVPEMKSKVPEMSRGKSIFFVTPDNNLQRDNPRQGKLPLTAIDEPKRKIADVND